MLLFLLLICTIYYLMMVKTLKMTCIMDRRDTTFLSASLAQNYQLTMQQAITFHMPLSRYEEKHVYLEEGRVERREETRTLERSIGEQTDGCRGHGSAAAAAGSWGRVESARRDRSPASAEDAAASAREKACARALDRVRNRDAILSRRGGLERGEEKEELDDGEQSTRQQGLAQ